MSEQDEDRKAAEEYAKRVGCEDWEDPVVEHHKLKEGFLAGIAHQKGKERWMQVSEKPEHNNAYLCMIHAALDDTEDSFPSVVVWHNGLWESDSVVTHWKPIELPDKEVLDYSGE